MQFFSDTGVLKMSNPCKKPISYCMNHPFYNDQAYIAESFSLSESHIVQTARLAHFKINSYKLSLIKSSFASTRVELMNNLKENLLNYTCPAIILADMGFFKSETEN